MSNITHGTPTLDNSLSCCDTWSSGKGLGNATRAVEMAGVPLKHQGRLARCAMNHCFDDDDRMIDPVMDIKTTKANRPNGRPGFAPRCDRCRQLGRISVRRELAKCRAYEDGWRVNEGGKLVCQRCMSHG